VERRRVRSDEIQLTSKRCRLVPIPCHLFIFQVIPFPPWWRCLFLSPSREADRPVSPLERIHGYVATHQLLSEQLGRGPTPMVSYLCDCGDRGFRPF